MIMSLAFRNIPNQQQNQVLELYAEPLQSFS